MIHIKLNGTNATSVNLAGMEKIFKKYNPHYLFEYRFTDEEYAKKFNDDRTTATLSLLFSVLPFSYPVSGYLDSQHSWPKKESRRLVFVKYWVHPLQALPGYCLQIL
jgi:hypothetical protein